MIMYVIRKLKSIIERNERNKLAVNKDLFRIVCSKELLIISYNKNEKSKSGAPQGGILSPLLTNIYLNELDKFIIERIIHANKRYNK